ncbi:MAG: heptosyltransferase [Phycisphaerales bacterium]|nr:heptosyltransferase [Phycisphaerales bacterium]
MSEGISQTTPTPRIVIPIVAGIGNALLAVPMVRRIRRAWPGARITILARIGPMAEVFHRLGEVDEVIVTGKGIRGILAMIRAARQRELDIFLVPFPSNRWQYSLLAAASGAKRRVLHGYPVGYFRAMHFLPSMRVPAVRGIHDVEQNLRLLAPIGIAGDEPPEGPVFPVTEEDRARAATMLREAGLAANVKPIIVHAGSAQTVLARAKRWPTEKYRELIAALRAEAGDRVIVVEGPDEAGVAAEIVGVPARAPMIRLSGPLGEAAAMMERAELYVGTDSGLAHLAAAVGTPAVTIFAPADPDRVCPYGYRDLVVQPPPPCGPCYLYPWDAAYPKMRCHADHRCIERVTVDSVMAAVRRGRNGARR